MDAGSAGAKAAYEYGLLPRESLASRAGTLQVWIIGTIRVSICIDGFDCKAAGLRKEGQEQAFRRLKQAVRRRVTDTRKGFPEEGLGCLM